MKDRNPDSTNEKETSILNAARHRFTTYGYSKVTMDEIADDIGMGKASLYYYFPTKDEIFREVIRREQSEFLAQMRVMLKNNAPASQKLRAYFQLRTNYSNQIFSLSWHNRQLWPSMKPIFKDLFQNLAKEEQSVLTRLIHEGGQLKEFNVPEPEKIALLIMNVLQGLRMRLFYADPGLPSKKPPHKEFEREIMLFIEMLLNGIMHNSHR
jgi:TetR/AcrR family transcriptional regulator